MAVNGAPTALDIGDLAARLRLSVARLARLLRRQDEGDLGATLGSALATIDREGPVTLGELALLEHVAPPSITRVAGKLEERGLVVRRADAQDRRISRLEVTPAGRRQIEGNRSRRTAWLAQRLADLTAEDRQALEAAIAVLEGLVSAPDCAEAAPGRQP